MTEEIIKPLGTCVLSVNSELNLIKKLYCNNLTMSDDTEINNIVHDNFDLLRGTGCMKEKYKTRLKEGAIPKVHPPR